MKCAVVKMKCLGVKNACASQGVKYPEIKHNWQGLHAWESLCCEPSRYETGMCDTSACELTTCKSSMC